MARYLITQSLLSAWSYVHSCYEGCEEDAMESFLAALRREPSEITEAMQNGIDFENAVYAEASGQMRPPHEKWEHGIQQVAAFLKGAQFQVRVQREIRVAGMTFLVYGVLDALHEGIIEDIKFKNKSFGSLDLAGEYFDSPQHPFYFFLVPEARMFRYLVSDGQDIYIEQYTPDETQDAGELIAEFVEFLNVTGLMDTYKQYWAARE